MLQADSVDTMNGEASFSSMAPPTFGGESYQIWAVRMQTYLEALDLWEAVDDEYEIAPLPNNPTVAQIKTHKERTTRKSKAKACLCHDPKIEVMMPLTSGLALVSKPKPARK